MNYSNLKKMDRATLEKKISQYKKEIFNMRFQLSDNAKLNVNRFRYIRRNIARCKTAFNYLT